MKGEAMGLKRVRTHREVAVRELLLPVKRQRACAWRWWCVCVGGGLEFFFDPHSHQLTNAPSFRLRSPPIIRTTWPTTSRT